MSADLFAAFMNDEPPDSKPGSTRAVPTTNPQPQRNVLSQPLGSVQYTKTHVKDVSNAPLWKQDSGGAEILFDADEAGNEDDFGDFEDVDTGTDGAIDTHSPSRVDHQQTRLHDSASVMQITDLVSLEDDPWINSTASAKLGLSEKTEDSHLPATSISITANHEAAWDAGDDDWGNFEHTQEEHQPLPGSAKSLSGQKPLQNVGEIENEDDWEPFEDGEPQNAAIMDSDAPNYTAQAQSKSLTASTIPHAAIERPTNVPPPTTLLQLFLSAISMILEMNRLQQKSKQEVGSSVLLLYRVISRTIAGRTLRWKRDTILAQSVRIGQAGKAGGMKLASINKSESAREEREVEDLVSQWSRHTHEFNSILAQAHMTGNRLKINSSPSLKILKAAGSSKQCALCGLQRNERLNDVDAGVEDLFGEFWTEHWGHNDCCEFWYLYKDRLAQR